MSARDNKVYLFGIDMIKILYGAIFMGFFDDIEKLTSDPQNLLEQSLRLGSFVDQMAYDDEDENDSEDYGDKDYDDLEDYDDLGEGDFEDY